MSNSAICHQIAILRLNAITDNENIDLRIKFMNILIDALFFEIRAL